VGFCCFEEDETMKKLAMICVLMLVFLLMADEGSSYVDIAELIHPSGWTRGVAVKGNYAYSFTREGSLYTYNISDIYNASSFTTYTPISDPLVVDVGHEYGGNGLMDYQDYIYLYHSNQVITVVSIENPASPTVINEVAVFGWVYKMVRSGDYLILCYLSHIGIYSLATPSEPAKVGDEFYLENESYLGDLLYAAAVYENHLYVAGLRPNPTLYIIDFSDPTNLSLLDSYPLPDAPYHMKVVDNKLVTSCTNSAQLWSLVDPLHPVIVDAIELQGYNISGRVCAQDNDNTIFSGDIYSAANTSFEFIQSSPAPFFFQIDGFPYGSDVVENEDQSYIFLTGDLKVRVLKSEMGIADNDNDGVFSDGDLSGIIGDNPCTGGDTGFCDDNCPNTPNPLQEDTYPPQGNGIGDACDCEADFECDGDVDAEDVLIFLQDFGRSVFCGAGEARFLCISSCTNETPCPADFDCDTDVDATDVTKFLEDFGRSQYSNPCPACVVGDWCVYP